MTIDVSNGKMLKSTAPSIATPVTKLFNIRISSGCFPTIWKTIKHCTYS